MGHFCVHGDCVWFAIGSRCCMSACAHIPMVYPSAIDSVVNSIRRTIDYVDNCYGGCILQAPNYNGTSNNWAVFYYRWRVRWLMAGMLYAHCLHVLHNHSNGCSVTKDLNNTVDGSWLATNANAVTNCCELSFKLLLS